MGWGEGSGQTVGIERTFLLVSAATRRSEASHTLRPPRQEEARMWGSGGLGAQRDGAGAPGSGGILLPMPGRA